MIGRDPILDNRLLRVANIEQPVALNDTAQFQAILRLSVPLRLDAAPWLRPEIDDIIAAAEARRDEVIDLMIGVRATLAYAPLVG